MANSLRAKLSKLRRDRYISEKEYQAFIKKLDGHDKQIKADAIVEALSPYDAESIEDLVHNVYGKGKMDAIKLILQRLKALWYEYEEDRDNVPKPDFYSAYALIAMMEEHNNDSQI